MVDLGHREPKRREPGLLLQHRGDVALHGRQLTLGGADLVAAPGRHDDAGGVFRLRAKRRQRTISLNTFVSVAGITLGVAALIGTLGIMTGFKEGTIKASVVEKAIKDMGINPEKLNPAIS